MSNNKLNIGILFGGKSAEHEISLKSAKNVIDALDKERFNPVLIGISPEGQWLYNENELLLAREDGYVLNENSTHVALLPRCRGILLDVDHGKEIVQLDAVFPILHGPFGEDGTVQGLLKLAEVPFVGVSVLGAAVGMDKDIMKKLLQVAGLGVGKYVTTRAHEPRPTFEEIENVLGLPFFVKPANLGSSVGITKVESYDQFDHAMDEAFSFDRKVVIEAMIVGRELECAVLGNEFPKASVPGEVTFTKAFYSFEAKYLDEKAYRTEIPAKLTELQVAEVQHVAVEAYKALECEGLGRVDVFLTADDQVYVNEINTIPGFTQVSMYPQLWEKSGVPYGDLITNLIQLAIERFAKEQDIKSSRL